MRIRRANALVQSLSVLLLAVALLAVGCATTGPRGQTSLIIIPTAQEVGLGAQVDASIREEYAVLPEGPLTEYVREIGGRLAVHSDRRDVEYHFTVLDDEIVNAFAAPGGFIYVTTGLMAYAGSEAELAGVIAHELGHVVARHSVRKVQAAYGAALLADLLLGDRETLAQIAGTATALLMLKFSRDDEYVADEFGVKYAAAAGYDASQMSRFLGRMLELQGGPSPEGMASWFSTHPPTQERIERCNGLVAMYQGPSPELGADRYLRITSSLRP